MLQGKTIVLGVCGGIAAYKAAALCSKLTQEGANVRVIMTASAIKFITPLTFQTLSRNHVGINTFAENDSAVISHIDLADHADLFVVAPATANMLAKMACGLADDMLSTALLATQAEILVAPAMNVHMYSHYAVQKNRQTLLERGVKFIEPDEGQLACGYVGKGRLAEPDEIFREIIRILLPNKRLSGKKVLVTAGGTKERIDPVRYLANDSSGKMGFAVAEAAKEMGAQVTLIYGSTTASLPTGMETISVITAEQMLAEVMMKLPEVDIVIKAAAVSDYRPKEVARQKIKKQAEQLHISFEKTQDILQWIGENKTKQFVVGFAAETEAIEQNAMSKLHRKNCDLIVANDVTVAGAGFGSDTNRIQIYDQDGLVESLPLMSKKDAARKLLTLVAERVGLAGSEM